MASPASVRTGAAGCPKLKCLRDSHNGASLDAQIKNYSIKLAIPCGVWGILGSEGSSMLGFAVCAMAAAGASSPHTRASVARIFFSKRAISSRLVATEHALGLAFGADYMLHSDEITR